MNSARLTTTEWGAELMAKNGSDRKAPLSPKQARFVLEYLKDNNATQAAIRAGYSFGVTEGHYCYLLVDPRDGQVFYVGKGVRGRLLVHARHVRAGRVDNALKCRRIAAVHAAGLEVLELVFVGGLTEREAFAVEKAMISALRDHGLTNIADGNSTNAERLAEQVAAFKRGFMPEWLWRRTARPDQIAMVEGMGGHAAFREQLFAELDEALAISN